MTAKTAEELYDVARRLPAKERLRLAALILQDAVLTPIEESDTWSEEDLQDLTRASLEYVAQADDEG